MATRRSHHGVFKPCACPRRQWPKCEHSYRLAFRWQKGKHYRLSLDKTAGRHLSKVEADIEAERVRGLIRAGQWGTTAAVLPSLTLGGLLDVYARDVLATRPKGTPPNARYQMNAIGSAVLRLPNGEFRRFKDWALVDVTTAALEQFRSARQVAAPVVRKGRGSRTIGGPGAVIKALSFLRAVFNWAIRAGYLEQTPFIRQGVTVVTLGKAVKRDRRLQDGEADRLLPVCGPHLRAVVECALETGMRKGEILGLRWTAIQGDEIRLSGTQTKTGMGRTIPISTRLQAILAMRKTITEEGFVFGNEIGQRVRDIKRAWATACTQAGSADLRFHDLRREAGSRWLDGGVPLHVVRDWLGHTSVAQTSTYLSTTTKTAKDAMRTFEQARSRVQPSATDSGKGVQNGAHKSTVRENRPIKTGVEHTGPRVPRHS